MVRVGVWGTFDLEHLGHMLAPRIVRAELARRVPSLELRTWSPIGYVGLNRFEGDDEPARPLGTWNEERLAELATQIDVLVIGGGDLIGEGDVGLAAAYGLDPVQLERRASHRFFVEGLGKHEVDVPTAWHGVGVVEDPTAETAARFRAALAQRAYVTVRDEASRERLEMAGVDREILVVPDAAFLAPRLFPVEGLAERVQRLREAGRYPGEEALVVQGGRGLLQRIDEVIAGIEALCRARRLVPVLVETGPIDGDGAFADAAMQRLPGARRLPPFVGVEDLLAAIAWSAGFVGSSLHGNIVAAAYDRPGLVLNFGERERLEGAGRALGAPERVVSDPRELSAAFERVWDRGTVSARMDDLRRRVDEHFDRLAELGTAVRARPDAPPVVPGSTVADERERYTVAVRALGARMAAQQAAFVDRERDLEAWIKGQATEIVEKDIRFTKLWRRLHEGDRHYHWHVNRADTAEELVGRLKEEVAWLKGVVAEQEAELARRSDEIDRLRGAPRLRRWLRTQWARVVQRTGRFFGGAS